MPSSTAVHGHRQRWTMSYRRFTVALAMPSMAGTTLMALDIAHEEVDIHTHGIVHLENHMET
jgi:hypothetical protein